MPRGRSKNTKLIPSPKDGNRSVNNDINGINIKMEPEEAEPTSSCVIPDLSQFKFQKKPHVKIEFEQDPPKNEVEGLWEPPNWREFLVNLKNMRSNNDAPVDSMGCHMAMDENAPPEVMRYQSLIALMLSSQTKDQVTFAAMERLRAQGLTVDNVLKLSDEELGKLIYPVGFWKTKVKYIKKTTQTLKEQYNGDIPDSVEKLCKLTGVGPKMAHICMKVAWNKITGIGVDTHVHRISNRIGWVKKPTATPEDTRKALQTWLPFELWSEVNHLMVGFGQTICTPISPICNECLNRDICPSSGKGRKSPSKKTPIKQDIKTESNESVEKQKRVPTLNIDSTIPKTKIKKSPKQELHGTKEVTLEKNEKLLSGKNILNRKSTNKETCVINTHQPFGNTKKSFVDDGSQNKNQVCPKELNEKVEKSPLKRKSPRIKTKNTEQMTQVTGQGKKSKLGK